MHFQTILTSPNIIKPTLPSPLSLTTTNGVSYDFLSYRYLDVSVPCVSLPKMVYRKNSMGFPIRRSVDQRYSPLPTAYRSVIRPSSPPNVKASTECPFALVVKESV